MSFVGVVLAILAVIVLGAIPIGWLILRRLRENEVSDTFVLNEYQRLAPGRAIGWLQNVERGKKGRLHIKYLSFDADRLESVEEIVEPQQIVFQAKRTLSRGKNILRILPRDSLGYFQNLFNQIEENGTSMHIIKAQKAGLERAGKHLEEMGEGEVSSSRFGQYMDQKDEILRSQAREQDRKSVNRYQEVR